MIDKANISKPFYNFLTYNQTMSQYEVYNFLKNNPGKWWTSKEIAKKMTASIASVTNNLKKIRKSKEILYRISGDKNNQYFYRFKK